MHNAFVAKSVHMVNSTISRPQKMPYMGFFLAIPKGSVLSIGFTTWFISCRKVPGVIAKRQYIPLILAYISHYIPMLLYSSTMYIYIHMYTYCCLYIPLIVVGCISHMYMYIIYIYVYLCIYIYVYIYIPL